MSTPRLAHAALTSILLAVPTLARSAPQEPKVGSVWYEENVDLGFRIKSPKDWDFIPPSPLEANLIGKYAPPNGTYISLGSEAVLFLNVWLVKFDRRAAPKADADTSKPGVKEMVVEAGTAKDLDAWMSGGIDEGSGWHRTDGPKPLKGPGVPATWKIYEGLSTNGSGPERKPVRCYVAEFELAPDVDVALVGIGPADGKWRVYEKAFETMAKSFQRMQVVGTKATPAATDDPRAQKRARLQAEVAKSPGWSLHETPNYFVISSYNDKQFIEELKLRLESIRAVFEKDYPPSKARRIKVAMTEEDEGDDEGDDDDGEDDPPAEGEESDDEQHSVAVTTIDPLLLSRCSVVRVCKDRDQYIQYGGPPGTGGYWLYLAEELVVFDDKAVQGTAATWGTLNHEAFHQYIYYFYGAIAPHSWYNEGTGDYYSGFEFKNGKFKAGPSIGRKSNLKDITSQGRQVPLQEFVRWSKAKYYGQNERKLAGYECYAQGWSLIWFLRTGQGNAKGWQKPWNSILDRYLETLLDTGDLDKAIDKAFEGVDWKAFESCWLNYVG